LKYFGILQIYEVQPRFLRIFNPAEGWN